MQVDQVEEPEFIPSGNEEIEFIMTDNEQPKIIHSSSEYSEDKEYNEEGGYYFPFIRKNNRYSEYIIDLIMLNKENEEEWIETSTIPVDVDEDEYYKKATKRIIKQEPVDEYISSDGEDELLTAKRNRKHAKYVANIIKIQKEEEAGYFGNDECMVY